jgi:alkanesulfonate monooxygenase SsuD/methylene tetrahydromethanopterin reductase-like flavin-dependent oxidoreductase (luciferase family)
MQYGIILTAGDPRTQAELAAAAEQAGWDGVFSWDGISLGAMDTFDPWVLMAAMAMRTERVTLGAILTPTPRRRPWKLARETMTLDRLSNGRLVVPVGIGAIDDQGFGNVGEPVDAPTRSQRLNESLDILGGLWSGEPFEFDGRHYRFGPMTFRPTPIQQPRIPIWVAANLSSDASVARALRWDGIMPQTNEPDAIAELAARVGRDGLTAAGDRPYAIVVEGQTKPGRAKDRDRVQAVREAGATWWIESDWTGATVESITRRIAAGPPQTG